MAARGRFYKQNGAVFWSDDYTGGDRPLGRKGQYWTGDRELSPFSSLALGLRATYLVHPSKGRWLGLISSLKVAASADVLQFSYDEYTLGGVPIDNARAFIFGANLAAVF